MQKSVFAVKTTSSSVAVARVWLEFNLVAVASRAHHCTPRTGRSGAPPSAKIRALKFNDESFFCFCSFHTNIPVWHEQQHCARHAALGRLLSKLTIRGLASLFASACDLTTPSSNSHPIPDLNWSRLFTMAPTAVTVQTPPAAEPVKELAAEISCLEIQDAETKPEGSQHVPPHRSHDPQFNQKRSDPFQFGSRYLGQDDDEFEFNAWDHVEPDDMFKEYAEKQYAMQREAPVSDFDKRMYRISFLSRTTPPHTRPRPRACVK